MLSWIHANPSLKTFYNEDRVTLADLRTEAMLLLSHAWQFSVQLPSFKKWGLIDRLLAVIRVSQMVIDSTVPNPPI